MSGSGLDVGGKSSSQRIASLDGLRTLSIVMVLFGHLWGTNGFPKNAVTEALAQYAHLGVQVFFVISGFLITTLLLREHKSTGRIDLYAFYRRRMFRIFPAAFFYITVMAIVARPGYLWWAYTYLMCYAGDGRPWLLGHLWSLSVEEQFYMVWPLALITWFSRRATVAIAVFLLAPVARLVFWQFGMHSIDEYFPAVADSLAAGCLMADSPRGVYGSWDGCAGDSVYVSTAEAVHPVWWCGSSADCVVSFRSCGARRLVFEQSRDVRGGSAELFGLSVAAGVSESQSACVVDEFSGKSFAGFCGGGGFLLCGGEALPEARA